MPSGVHEPGRAEQAHNWWIKGLGGLVNIAQQISDTFGPPNPKVLGPEIERLVKLGGQRYTVSEEGPRFVITDHKLSRMSWDGGATWRDGVLGS